MKATARAYAIQGLIKYHGLRNEKLRIPFHDSISVCMKALPTITTVESSSSLKEDLVRVDGKTPSKNELKRIQNVLDGLRRANRLVSGHFRVESRNPPVSGKGLGFSASGFAALGLATSRAMGLGLSTKQLSEIVRTGAGSAARSLVGGFSIWYARRDGRSYAEQLGDVDSVPLRTVISPIPSPVKTDLAHVESVKSPFYKARMKSLPQKLREMRRAVRRRDVGRMAELAEEDTLSLHAVTMTGPNRMLLLSPLSIILMDEVRRLRIEEGIPVWYSLDTGPSVFANTTTTHSRKVLNALSKLYANTILSEPGGPAELVKHHLF